MRVSSKVALSSGLLTVILIGVLAYNTTQVRRLAELHRDLAEVDLRAATVALDQQRIMPQLENAALKYLLTRDLDYADRVRRLRTSFEAGLDTLETLELSERVRHESDTLRRNWEESALSTFPDETIEELLAPEEEELLGVSVRNGLESIRAQLARLTEAARETVHEESARTFEASRRARTASWIVIAVALACAVPILLVTLWSIREPLRRLEEGTRSIARGVYAYPRLDDTRSDEFTDIAAGFNDMVARLGELDQMKRDFLSHVSHELRTPLVTMDETNRLLLEELPGPLNDEQRRFLELNLDGSRRLADMISKLLDLSRLEDRAVLFELQANDLVELVRRVADGFAARARELGLSIEIEADQRPVLAECDADRITQLVSNLVDNALKYSPPAGVVLIRVLPEGDLPAPTGVRHGTAIQVTDSGPGVPDEEKQRIFEKFHQVGRPRTGGVGLGLAICSQIAAAHEGAIWVEDGAAGGSVFWVALPAAASQRSAQTG